MSDVDSLTERERRVLEAVIETYIATAEPAGSHTVARRSALGISPASIRSTMSELEVKGFLYHPHTSAGRIPTDRAYRLYVDAMVQSLPPEPQVMEHLEIELSAGLSPEDLVVRAAQVLGILTQELGVGVAPALEAIVLERVDLVSVSTDRLLLVLNLRSGTVRSIYIRLRGALDRAQVDDVQRVLNSNGSPGWRCARSGQRSPTGCATPPRRRTPVSCSTSSWPRATASSTCMSRAKRSCLAVRRC